ncbi:MAG: hypothetical protein ABIK92_21820 [Pseudomonadota bacterium]|uniref:Uncharacterized protein n=1 Tax=viral metagenome TaxID=1070528 RepID=A0A6M3L4X1_9ZZZZ
MPQPEMPKEMPSLDKVKIEDLRQWKSIFSTAPFLYFKLWLEQKRNEIAILMLSPERMRNAIAKGKTYEYFQGENAMIDGVQAFFKDVEHELSARQHNAANVANANNERKRRRNK